MPLCRDLLSKKHSQDQTKINNWEKEKTKQASKRHLKEQKQLLKATFYVYKKSFLLQYLNRDYK